MRINFVYVFLLGIGGVDGGFILLGVEEIYRLI